MNPPDEICSSLFVMFAGAVGNMCKHVMPWGSHGSLHDITDRPGNDWNMKYTSFSFTTGQSGTFQFLFTLADFIKPDYCRSDVIHYTTINKGHL